MLRNYLFLLLAAVAGSCNTPSSGNTAQHAIKPPAPGEMETTVSVQKTARSSFRYFISANGKVRSMQEQLLLALTSGKLIEYHAQTGRSFHTGGLIARIDTTPIRHRLDRDLLTKFHSAKEYESQLLGYEVLLKEKPASQVEEIRKKLKISTGLAAAEQSIVEAEYELSKTAIRAPFSGMLADIKVQEGEQLRPGQEICRIYDPYQLLLEIKVLEADVFMLKNGMPADVSPVSMPALHYKASVAEINPYVDESGLVLVKLRISDTKKPLLFPGMNCMAIIHVPFRETLAVPREAIVIRSGKSIVFTMEAGKARWNYVHTGRDNGKEVEITEGLQPGQLIITSNNLQLEDNTPVREAKD